MCELSESTVSDADNVLCASSLSTLVLWVVQGNAHLSSPCSPVTLSSAALLTFKFKSFSLLFLKIILIVYLLDRFNTLRPSELCATQTHSFGFKTLLSV